MNKKIKIFLQETGSTAVVDIGFRIYQGSYKATDIELYVPADLIQTTEDVGTSVSIAGIEVDETGKTYNTRVYYLVDPVDETVAGIDYKKYTRGLPSTFTKYAGRTTVVANVVQVDSSDPETPLIETVITSQRVDIPIESSRYIEDTEIIEPDDITAIYAELAKKQNIVDNTLTTTNKTIPTAINELKSGVDENTEDIAQNTTDISSNTSRIVALENQAITGKTYIGDMSGSSLPTDSQLTAFVQQTVERTPKNGDTINFTLVVSSATDVQYEYTYTASGWKGVPRPTVESASNTDKGIIKGTYQQGVDYAIQVDIAGGEIKNIYFENNDGNLTGLKYYVNANDLAIKNIINGTTKVGKALNADNDGEGNNIIATYQTQTSGASKTYVRNYALPREFNDIYFFVTSGYQKETPTGTAPIKTQVVATPTETELFRFSKNETASYELSSKNSAYTKICIEASEDCSVYFKLVTQVTQGSQTYTLSEETTNLITLTADEITKVAFDDAFTSLGDTVLRIDNNATITQVLKVITNVYDSITFSMYSGTGYPSTMALNTQLAVIMQGEVDQTFDPTSTNAQSGIAVEQALGTVQSSYTFPTKNIFELWLERNYERPDGRTIDDLKVGDIVLIGQEGVTDYWCKSIEKDLRSNMSIEDNFNEFGFDLSGYQRKMQFEEMPTPSFEYYGKTVQYVGETGEYTNSFFYKCVMDSESDISYSATTSGVYARVEDFDDTADELGNLPDGQTIFEYNILTNAWSNNGVVVDLEDYGVIVGSSASATTAQYKNAGALTINGFNLETFRDLVEDVQGRYTFRMLFPITTITATINDETVELHWAGGDETETGTYFIWTDGTDNYYTNGKGWLYDKYTKTDYNLYAEQERETVVGTITDFEYERAYETPAIKPMIGMESDNDIGYVGTFNHQFWTSYIAPSFEGETENDYFIVVLGGYPADGDEVIITKSRVDGYTWEAVQVQEGGGLPIRRLGDE